MRRDFKTIWFKVECPNVLHCDTTDNNTVLYTLWHHLAKQNSKNTTLKSNCYWLENNNFNSNSNSSMIIGICQPRVDFCYLCFCLFRISPGHHNNKLCKRHTQSSNITSLVHVKSMSRYTVCLWSSQTKIFQV